MDIDMENSPFVTDGEQNTYILLIQFFIVLIYT